MTIQERKNEFAEGVLKSIKEIQGTGIQSLTRIADSLNKRGGEDAKGREVDGDGGKAGPRIIGKVTNLTSVAPIEFGTAHCQKRQYHPPH